MKILDKIRKDSFRGKIFFLLTVGSTATVLLLTVIWLTYAWYTVEKTVQRDLQTIAVRTSGEIDQYLLGKIDSLMAIRELLSYPDENHFKLGLMLKRISLQFDQFQRLSLLDGSPNKSSSNDAPYQLIASSVDDKGTTLPKDVLNIVLKGEVYRSPMLLSEDKLPYMKMAIPLFWQGEVFRILVADINILDIWNKIDEIRIGETGRASILSAEGIFLADADKERVLKMQRWQDISESILPLGEKEGSLFTSDRDGRYLDVAHAEIPSTGWILVITQERRESMHFLIVMLYNALFIILISIVGSYYASALISRRLSKPIEELHQGVGEIAKGNFQYQVPLLAGKELEALRSHLNAMAQALEEKEKTDKKLAELERMASVGRMAADVAHEVNNPLGIMKNYIAIMQNEMNSKDDPIRQYVDVLKEEISRICRIIHSFTEFYKGNRELKLREVDPLIPFQDVLAFCRRELDDRDITIVEELAEVGTVMADSDKLEQVFLNLIKNAMEAMPGGGRLRLSSCKQPGEISFTIADTGMGIEKECMGKLFDPFFSTKGVKGTGLGLSVSYGIINNMSGDIEVESEEGKETIFKVILPALEG